MYLFTYNDMNQLQNMPYKKLHFMFILRTFHSYNRISEIRSLRVKTVFAFPFAQLHVSMTENCLALLFMQCARASSLDWSTVINLLVHYFGVLYNCRFRHSKQLLWNKTIIAMNYLLRQTHVYLQNEWLEMAAAK